eukprot:scaffold27233_cov129-Isochrysis_galbana.AAC.2
MARSVEASGRVRHRESQARHVRVRWENGALRARGRIGGAWCDFERPSIVGERDQGRGCPALSGCTRAGGQWRREATTHRAGERHVARGERQLERAGHLRLDDILRLDAALLQCLFGSFDERVADLRVPPRLRGPARACGCTRMMPMRASAPSRSPNWTPSPAIRIDARAAARPPTGAAGGSTRDRQSGTASVVSMVAESA